jgi:transcriptional regulator GlxA family with amidase domain
VTHLAAAAEAYLSESTRSEDQESLAARALAEYLAIVIARELALDCPPERYNRQHRMRDLWERVNAAPGATWTVDGMAHELAISSRQFQRLMHEVYRVSASEMLLRLRMQRAQELLLSTNLTLEAIAQRVGYGYVYSFCKAFKRAHGCAPGAYRKSHIEGKPQ